MNWKVETEGNKGRRNQTNVRFLLPFVPAGQGAQLIVGATPDTDYRILKVFEG